jgi:hypothetical protein
MPTFSRIDVDQGDINVNRGKVNASVGGFVGPLTGDVTGSITGDITGNITGNVTGLINSAGLYKISQTLALAAFTDNEDATGTATLTTKVPAGAYVLGCAISALTGFTSAEDTSTATVTIGDGTDVDRYMTGTPSVIDDAAAGLALGVPSGVRYHDAEKTITVIVTEDDDFTEITGGSMTVELYYLT